MIGLSGSNKCQRHSFIYSVPISELSSFCSFFFFCYSVLLDFCEFKLKRQKLAALAPVRLVSAGKKNREKRRTPKNDNNDSNSNNNRNNINHNT